VALLTERAADPVFFSKGDGSYSAELLDGLAVFCGSVPRTCAPIFRMVRHPEAAIAAKEALERGLARSGGERLTKYSIYKDRYVDIYIYSRRRRHWSAGWPDREVSEIYIYIYIDK